MQILTEVVMRSFEVTAQLMICYSTVSEPFPRAHIRTRRGGMSNAQGHRESRVLYAQRNKSGRRRREHLLLAAFASPETHEKLGAVHWREYRIGCPISVSPGPRILYSMSEYALPEKSGKRLIAISRRDTPDSPQARAAWSLSL